MISLQETFDDLYRNPRDPMRLPYTAQQVVRKPVDRKPKLYFTIGLQRSGKSTYCTRWAQNLEMPGDGYPRAIVCADSIRLAFHGERYLRKPEPFIFTFDTLMIQSLLERGHDVIADETATTERSIRRILSIDINAQHIVIDTPKEECQRRAILTGQVDLVPVIERVSVQFEKLRRIGFDVAVERVREAVRNRNDNPVL
jgi:predicted kinase